MCTCARTQHLDTTAALRTSDFAAEREQPHTVAIVVVNSYAPIRILTQLSGVLHVRDGREHYVILAALVSDVHPLQQFCVCIWAGYVKCNKHAARYPQDINRPVLGFVVLVVCRGSRLTVDPEPPTTRKDTALLFRLVLVHGVL